MREQTYDTPKLLHPEWIGGNQVWVETSDTPGRLAHKLQHGDPAKGWEGDPRLVLSYHAERDQWEILRFEADGTYRLVARKPPGQMLDDRIIDELVARDTRRGFDIARHIYDHNARLEREQEDAQVETLMESWDRFRHAARKEGLA